MASLKDRPKNVGLILIIKKKNFFLPIKRNLIFTKDLDHLLCIYRIIHYNIYYNMYSYKVLQVINIITLLHMYKYNRNIKQIQLLFATIKQ